MNRQRPLVPSDVTSGQSYGFWKAFAAAGGTWADMQVATENSSCMQLAVKFIKSAHVHPAVQLGDRIPELMLEAAVAKGVQQIDEYTYRFFDPGMSLSNLQVLPTVVDGKLIHWDSRYESCTWAHKNCSPQERTIRLILKEAFHKTFLDQKRLLIFNEDVAPARLVVTFLVINALATNTYLLPNRLVRCIDEIGPDSRVCVGNFKHNSGLQLHDYQNHGGFEHVGVAFTQKS
jgi:hypothetical protein